MQRRAVQNKECIKNKNLESLLEQTVFGLGGSVPILTDVMSHKLNALRTEQAFLKGQGKIL